MNDQPRKTAGDGGERPGIPRPDPSAGPWAELACQLHDELYVPRGHPTVATIAGRTGISAGHVHKMLTGKGRSRWEPMGHALVSFLGGDPEDWKQRWAQAERRYRRGLRMGAVPPLPWVDGDAGRPAREQLGVRDWQHRGLMPRRGPAAVVRPLLGLLAVALAVGPVLVRADRTGLAATAGVAAAELIALYTWSRRRRGGRGSLRRRQIMIKQVQVRSAQILARIDGDPLPARFASLTERRDPRPPVRTGRAGRRGRMAPDVMRHPLGQGTTVRALFADAAENLVVISDAGLGKTIQLAQLAHDLTGEALAQLEEVSKGQRQAPPVIPILLSLATYKGQPLREWLVAEIKNSYNGISAKVSQAWLHEDALLPLLDGLDEVPAEHRRACADEIREFRAQCTGVAVACRERDYGLARALRATAYVEIVKPSRYDVQEYLDERAGALADVRAALEFDPSLWGILQSPLMLNIIARTYAGETATELRAQIPHGERRGRIFDAYLRRMLHHRPSRYADTQTSRYLTWLARGMTSRGENTFYMDRLNDSWVRREDLKFAKMAPRTIFTVACIALTLVWLAFAKSLGGAPVAVGQVAGLAACLIGLVVVAYHATPSPERPTHDHRAHAAIGVMTLPLAAGHGAFQGAAMVLLLCGVWASLSSLSAAMRSGYEPVEQLRWGWTPRLRLAHPGVSAGKAVGLFETLAGLSLGLAAILAIKLFSNRSVPSLTLLILTVTVVITGLLELVNSDRVTDRDRPNEGIRRSARYAATRGLIHGAVTFAVAGPLLIMTARPALSARHALLVASLLAAMLAFTFAFRCGGLAILYHWAIRTMLIHRKSIPLRFQYFLHDAEQRILICRVGSGFTFPHRLLQEHIARPGKAPTAGTSAAAFSDKNGWPVPG